MNQGRDHGGDWTWLRRDALAWQAVMRGDKTAIVDLAEGRILTYAELDGLVRQTAGRLQASFKPGARVAVLARNSDWQVALFYACARAGAVFVPINWRLSGPEIAALLDDCDPQALIVAEEFAAEAKAALAIRPVEAVIDPAAWQALVAQAAPSDAGCEDPHACCTILYTSGSTGRSKGVMVTAKTGQASGQNYVHVSRLAPDSVMLCETPLFHVVGLLAGLHGSMIAGATLLLADRFVPAQSLARLTDPALGITHSFCVPQMAKALREDPAWAGADLSRLTALFSGGAPLPTHLIEDFLQAGVVMANGYGMTEAGTLMCMPLHGESVRARPESVGFNAPALEVRLVTPEGRDAAPGEVGEIWLRGPSVMPGYWNQPEATAAAFTDGWLRTGDAARRDEAGFYFIVDRWKDMYISGGENVYPAEVEAVLAAALPVADLAVVGVPDDRWGESGCAYVVPRPGATLLDVDILAACAGRLARYKHPRHVRVVETIPRTASGKIRKDVLRKQFAAEASTEPRS